ncbi:MAG: hypothetical protein AAGD07_21045 [Planctomycetota bacterium]
MPITSKRLSRRLAGGVLVSCVLASQSGCVLPLVSNVMHAVGADRVPPKFDGLEKSRVAIITMTDRSRYSEDINARLMSRKLGEVLLEKVDDVRIVREDEVQQWRDTHGWENEDLAELGGDLKADLVLAIQLRDLKLREGATLYRGSANVIVQVVDPADGSELFRHEIDDFMYPKTAGQYTTETTETKFRKLYLSMLARQVGRLFHPYDFAETIALDGAIASQ